MASKSAKFDRELFRLLIKEFKVKYKIDCSSINEIDKIRLIINEETNAEYEARLNEQEEHRRQEKNDKNQGKEKVKGKLSDETIKRAFEFKKSYDGSHDSTTCSIIACKVGYDGWNDFCKKAEVKYNYINGFQTTDMYSYNTLNMEQQITIGWYPTKYCIVRYLGEYEFEVIENQGLRSKIGRRFKTTGFSLPNWESKYTLPDIIIEPLFDDDPACELIKSKKIKIPEESELWL